MVLPGPGEVQLIGYDPSQPSADTINYAQDPNSNGEPPVFPHQIPESASYDENKQPRGQFMVTVQILVAANDPMSAIIEAMNGEYTPTNLHAELMNE